MHTIQHKLNKYLQLPAQNLFKKNCSLFQKWLRKDLNSAKVKVNTGRRSCFWMSQLFYSLLLTSPSVGSLPVNSQYVQATASTPPIMVCGCFSSQGCGGLYCLPKGQMINATCCINVLHTHLLAFINICGHTIFQQDSAPCYKGKAVTKWF